MADQPSQPGISQVYAWWWLHDGRWYQEVASRFGFDAANEINKAALKFLCVRVAKYVMKGLDKRLTEMTWDEVVQVFNRSAELMWPGESLEFHTTLTGPGTFKTAIIRNMALEMLKRAGTLDKYDCPCLTLREGWVEGMGLHLTENRMEECVRKGGKACVFSSCIAEFAESSQPDGPRGERASG